MAVTDVVFNEALIVGTQVDEAPTSGNMNVFQSGQVYTSDIEAVAPDYTQAQGVKFLDGTLSGDPVVRRSAEPERVPQSGTADREFKIELEGPDTMSFSTSLMGSNHSAPAAGEDFDLPPALRLLFESAGIVRSGGTSSSSIYSPGPPTYLSYQRFIGDDNATTGYKYGSCLVPSVVMTFPPGSPAILAWTVMIGHLAGLNNPNAFPNFPNLAPPAEAVGGYGKMDDFAPLPWKGAVFTAGGVVHKCGEMTLTITQGVNREGQANNASNGDDLYPTNVFDVTLTGDVYQDNTDPDPEFDNMDLELGADDYAFVYGTGEDNVANRLTFTLRNVTTHRFTPVKKGNLLAHTIDVRATAVGNVANTEFEILSNLTVPV